MTRKSEVEQVNDKVGLWKQAYDLIRPDMTVPGMREILITLQGDESNRLLPLYINLARVISANDRAAGTIAAMLVGTGIKPLPNSYVEGDEV